MFVYKLATFRGHIIPPHYYYVPVRVFSNTEYPCRVCVGPAEETEKRVNESNNWLGTSSSAYIGNVIQVFSTPRANSTLGCVRIGEG